MTTNIDMRQFLEGLLVALSVAGRVEAGETGDGLWGRIDRDDGPAIHVRRQRNAFGFIWEIEAEGERARAHPSAQGALRSLGALLAPDRPRGRVLFAADLGSAP